MFRPSVRVIAAAWTAAALLLAGGGVAAAAPDSGGDKGGGKPSPAASGNGNGNGNGNSNGNSNKTQGNSKPQGNSKASSPGNSAGSQGNSNGNSNGSANSNSGSNGQGNKPAETGKSNGNSQGANSNGSNGSSDTKTLPDTASPVAQAAVNKDKPKDTGATEEAVTPDPTTAPVPAESVDTPAPARDTAAQSGSATAAGSETDPQTRPAPAPDTAATPLSGRNQLPDAPATAAFTAPLSPAGDAGQVDSPEPQGVPARVGKWIGAAATTIAREVREALREVTLKDLALAALPGIAGLLFFLATGVGLGHRQARFNFVIETAGALRLAPRGPLGVVGSDSFVHVNIRAAAPRQRTLRLAGRAA